MEYRSALLASHGFVSMALEYLSADKFRTADVEFNYFEVCCQSPSSLHHPLLSTLCIVTRLITCKPQVLFGYKVQLFELSPSGVVSLCHVSRLYNLMHNVSFLARWNHRYLLTLQTAFNIIKEHPVVIKDRVGLFGLSFGTSVALSIAAHSEFVSVSICSLQFTFMVIADSHTYF